MTVRTLRGLLFDLDGTLIDTSVANYGAYALALRECGVGVDQRTVAEAAGERHWSDFLPPLLQSVGAAVDPGAVARRKGELYREMMGETRLNSALVALAAGCHPHMRTAIVTTASAASVHALLRCHQISDLFDAVITGDDVTHRKPDPEAYLVSVARLGLAPDDCLAFEDSDVGVRSARAAGIAVVRVVL